MEKRFYTDWIYWEQQWPQGLHVMQRIPYSLMSLEQLAYLMRMLMEQFELHLAWITLSIKPPSWLSKSAIYLINEKWGFKICR